MLVGCSDRNNGSKIFVPVASRFSKSVNGTQCKTLRSECGSYVY